MLNTTDNKAQKTIHSTRIFMNPTWYMNTVLVLKIWSSMFISTLDNITQGSNKLANLTDVVTISEIRYPVKWSNDLKLKFNKHKKHAGDNWQGQLNEEK